MNESADELTFEQFLEKLMELKIPISRIHDLWKQLTIGTTGPHMEFTPDKINIRDLFCPPLPK